MKKRKKRYALTLVEMMLVIVLVGIVGGALAVNLKGALDRGKGFKTKETKKRIEAIVNIASVEKDEDTILNQWQEIVSQSPLIKLKLNSSNQVLDAWGNAFNLEFDSSEDQFIATSAKIDSDGNIL